MRVKTGIIAKVIPCDKAVPETSVKTLNINDLFESDFFNIALC